MAVITDKVHDNEYVVLDGNTFNRCTFTNCRMIYRGGELPNLDACKITDCNWTFEDSAARTLQFLHVFHRGGMRQMVDQIIAKICQLPN